MTLRSPRKREQVRRLLSPRRPRSWDNRGVARFWLATTSRAKLIGMAAGTDNPTLADDDFRARRFYLPAGAFALVTGPYAAPTDPMPEEQWHELMNLPTDVLLRTSWSWWVQLLPLKPQAAPFIFNVGSDAAEDFNVSTFNAAHGYYRQGMFLLRSAVEGLTHAASFAKRQDKAGLQAWLSGDCESPKFGNARDILLPELGPDVTSVLSSSTRSCATTLTPGLAAAMPRSGTAATARSG